METSNHSIGSGPALRACRKRELSVLIGRQPHWTWCAAFVLLTACGAGDERVFDEYESPDGAWTLRVTVAESRMPHGQFHVGAYLIKRGETAGPKILDEKLANDGVPFTAKNVAVRWTSAGKVLMCLRATDLPDRGLRIEIGEPLRIETVDKC